MSTTETMSLEKAIELINDFDVQLNKWGKTQRMPKEMPKVASALLAAVLGRKPTKEEFQKLIERLG